MPAMIRRLSGGRLVAAGFDAEDLNDAALHEPRDGVYTVANTFCRTKTLLLGAHLDRLEDSAARARIPLELDRDRVRAALRVMIERVDYGDVRFRISIPAAAPDDLILSIEPFKPPSPALLQHGARCATSSASRRDPAAKSNEWMHERRPIAAATGADVYETILVDAAGNMLEGLGSNFYAVMGGVVYTAGQGVLAGVARRIVREVCAGIAPLRMQAARLSAVRQFDEAFITSSSRGIIPVVAIDGISIADGKVGETTRSLRAAYDDWAARHLEEL